MINETGCLCDPGVRECPAHTWLSLLLREPEGLGVWRLDTQGFSAAKELGLSVESIIKIYGGNNCVLSEAQKLPALDQRVIKRG